MRPYTCEKHGYWGSTLRCTRCAVEADMALAAEQKTFDQWHEEGLRIRKGATMTSRTKAGIPLFARRDTYNPNERRWPSNNRHGAFDRDYDECDFAVEYYIAHQG